MSAADIWESLLTIGDATTAQRDKLEGESCCKSLHLITKDVFNFRLRCHEELSDPQVVYEL